MKYVEFLLVAVYAVVCGVSLRTLQLYYRASIRELRAGQYHGILPAHVWSISASYLLLGLAGVIGGFQSTAIAGVTLVGLTLGAASLWLVMQFEKRKTGKRRPST